MSIYDDKINENLEYSRKIIKQLNHVKGSDELEDIQTLVFAGLLTYYGPEYLDDIYLAFLNCNFVAVDEPMDKFLRDKFKFNLPVSSRLQAQCPGTFYEVGAREYTSKKDKKIRYKFDRNIYVQNDGGVSIDELVQSVVHQVNHVLTSIHNPVVYTWNDFAGVASRMGLSFERMASRTLEGLALEDSINILQVDEIMEEILGFSFYNISDEKLSNMVNEIFRLRDEKGIVLDVAHDELTEMIRPLYEDKEFNEVLVNSRISGRINDIKSFFDSRTSMGTYHEFRTECDRVNDPRISPLIATDSRDKVKVYLKQYFDGNSSTEENK